MKRFFYRTVQKVSTSLHIVIPNEIVKQLEISKGDILSVSLRENKIVVESLKTLVGSSNPTANQAYKDVVSNE